MQLKRPLNSFEISGPRKRRQVDTIVSSARVKHSISFVDVFQEGRAQTKHVIVQFPKGSNKWYILRCEEHAFNFKDNPIMGAAAHLGSEKHGRMSREHAVVIEHLGIQVFGCDKTAAEKNNIVARKAFLGGEERAATEEADKQLERNPITAPTDSLLSRQTQRTRERLSRGHRSVDGRQQHQDAGGIVETISGQVYLGFWEMSKEWSAVLLLPTANLEDVGVPGTIEDLGLADIVPSCYDYNQHTKKFGWRDGYEDGGRLASQREFPVMYFDGLPFPAKSAVGWVAAKNLRAFNPDDPSSSLIPNLRLVRKFLSERQRRQLAETATERTRIQRNGTSE